MAIFMGLAFEGVYKAETRSSPGGIRTFPMLVVLGTLLYLLEPRSLAPYLIGLAGVALWLYGYARNEPLDNPSSPGLVVPASNLLAYVLAPIAITQPPWVVVAAAVAAVMLLEGRVAMHRLVKRVPSDEVFTLGKFLILIGVILPLLPDRPIVSWTTITPFKAWLALVAVSSLSYVSYLLQRYLPQRAGLLWPSILGGAYSSTATTVALARQQAASPQPRAELAGGIVSATAVMYLRIEVVTALFNPALARALLPALLALCALGALVAAWLWSRSTASTAAPATLAAINPLQLGTAALFAGLFVLLAVATQWVSHTLGAGGVFALAAVSGLTDIDPFVLSLAQGSVPGMSLPALAAAILLAASSNNVLKGCYALLFGGGRRCLHPALALFALGAIGLGSTLLY
jgi:uncharacterized membrane protein (DUF4010 family)